MNHHRPAENHQSVRETAWNPLIYRPALVVLSRLNLGAKILVMAILLIIEPASSNLNQAA